MRRLTSLCLLLMNVSAFAQIAPECAGVEKPADYHEGKQRAYLQNYFIAALMPLPFVSSHSSSAKKSTVGVDVSLVGRLSCQERLVLGGTKTENTSQAPIFPRLFAKGTLLSKDPLSLEIGATFLPPLPIPGLSIWHASSQATLSYEPITNVGLHLRGFISLLYLRSEIASPFDKNDPVKDDWFSFASIGGDLTASFGMPFSARHAIYPFISFGIIKGASIFAIGDDSKAVPNEDYPLLGGTNFVGLLYRGFGDQMHVGLGMGGVIGVSMAAHLQLAYGF